MKKFLAALCTLLCLNSFAQQSATVNRITIKDSIYFDGAWHKRWPGSTAVVGGVVTWVSGLQFAVTSAKYTIKDKDYSSSSGTITLNAAHVSLPRLDVIALNTSGQIVKITGVASATPLIPQINPATQVYLTTVLVNAGATTPGGVTSLTVYDENIEWPNTTDFASIDFNATATPYAGTKHISISGTDANDVSASGGLKFSDNTDHNYSNFTVLRFYIRLSAALPAGASFQVGAGNGGEPLTTITAANGFNSALTGVYQNISIPFSQIPKTSSTFTAVYMIVTGNGKSFSIDNIQLQGGVGGGSGPGYLTDVYKKTGTDSVFKVINGIHVFAYLDTGTGGGGADNWGTQVVQRNADLTGNGTTGLPLGINTANISTVQRVLDSAAVQVAKRDSSKAGGYYPYSTNPKNYIDLATGNASYKAIGWLPKLNELQPATAQNIIDNGGNYQQFSWDGAISSACFGFMSNPTSNINGSVLLYQQFTGVNSASGQTTITSKIANLKSGTGSTNIALDVAAQNGINNYAIRVQPGNGYSGFNITSPTAWLHIGAGTTTGAPLKLTSGTALTTPQDGAIEYHGSHLYFTIGSTRYQLDQQGGGGGGIVGVTASAPLIATGTTTINIAPDTTTPGTGLATLGQLNKKFNDSAFRVVRPVNNGTVKLFETPSSTALQIADVSAGTGAKVWKGADSVVRIAADTVTNFNSQTGTAYTLAIADQYGKTVTLSNASANTCTVPPNSSVAFPVGTVINVVQIGAGQTTITAGAGVTINSADAKLKLRVQYSGATLVKTATDTWILFGDITN